MEREIKKIVLEYIEKEDKLKFAKIFAPYEEYTIEQLLIVHYENIEYMELAKRYIFDNFERRNIISSNASKYQKEFAECCDIIEHQKHRIKGQKFKMIIYFIVLLAAVMFFNNKSTFKGSIRIREYKDLEQSIRTNVFYRGQSQSNWDLTPSVLRNFKESVIFDDNYYYQLLINENLEQKFNKLVRTKDTNTYDKYAYMQHACSYSPFIDFTSSEVIATSFSLSNKADINKFKNDSSAVYSVNVNKNDIVRDKKEAKYFLKNKFKIMVLSEQYFKFGKQYRFKGFDGKTATFSTVSFKSLLEMVAPKHKVFDIKTNDRMKYQKGVFVCFYDCLIIGERIFYELDPFITITKKEIMFEDKLILLSGIYKERTYDLERLMDPYLVFKE